MSDNNAIVYLSPDPSIYADPLITKGLTGMLPWLTDDELLTDHIRDIWAGHYRALDQHQCVILSSYGLAGLRARTTSKIGTLHCMGVPTTSGASTWHGYLTSPSCVDTRWQVDFYMGTTTPGWVYCSLTNVGIRRKGWPLWKKIPTYCRHSGKQVHEVLLPVIFPADGVDTELLLQYASGGTDPGSDNLPLARILRLHNMQLQDLTRRLSGLTSQLRNHADGRKNYRRPVGMIDLADDTIQALIKEKKAEVKSLERQLDRIKQEYSDNYLRLAITQGRVNQLMLQRGWKAILLAGMQLLDLTTIDPALPVVPLEPSLTEITA